MDIHNDKLRETINSINHTPIMPSWLKPDGEQKRKDVFEEIDPGLLKGIPGFKPLYKKISKQPSTEQILNGFYINKAKATAEEAAQDPQIKMTLEWMLQLVSAFEPEKLPEEILKEANTAEQKAVQTGMFFQALFRYQDLSAFAVIFGNAADLSRYANKCAQMIKIGKDRESSSSLCTDPAHTNRFNTIAQNSSKMTALMRQYYPVYEKKIIQALS